MNLNMEVGGLGAVDGFQMVKQSYCLWVLVFQHSVVKKHIQSGAEETHVFHIRITLFIFNLKKFLLHKKKVF